MTAEARQWRDTLRWSTNGDFFQTLSQQWALSPRDTSCYLIPGFTPSAARIVRNNIISKEDLPSVCTAMSLRLPSYMFCLVSSSSPVICNYTVVQSSTVYTVKQVTFIHAFIQLYIHTWIHSRINACTSYTQYQFAHDCISHPKSYFGRIPSVRSLPIIGSSRKFLKNKHLAFTFLLIKKCHPQCVSSRDVTHKAQWILANSC